MMRGAQETRWRIQEHAAPSQDMVRTPSVRNTQTPCRATGVLENVQCGVQDNSHASASLWGALEPKGLTR